MLIFWVSNSLISQIIPGYLDTKKPDIQNLNLIKKEKCCEINYQDVTIKILYDTKANCTYNLFKNKESCAGVLSYRMNEDYISEAFHFDINNDGVEDFFIVSYPYMASGIAANIQQIAAFISCSKSKWDLYELNSFLGAKELFIDIDDDDSYEYACIKMVKGLNDRSIIYYWINFFDFSNQKFVNNIEHLIMVKSSDSIEILDNIPNGFKRNKIVLEEPRVYR